MPIEVPSDAHNPYFTLTANHVKQATLTVDLASYVEAHREHGRQSPEYQTIRNDLVNYTSVLLAGGLWMSIREALTEGLEEDEKNAIENTPANKMLENNFTEILKNSIDVALDDYYESGKEAHVTLGIDIDNTTSPDLTAISITDSGSGFPKAFRDKVETLEGRTRYMQEEEGSKKRARPDRAEYFGGRGLGLRHFAANEQGLLLEFANTRKMDETPKEANLCFRNGTDATGQITGAQIVLTTSNVYQPKTVVMREALQAERDKGPSPVSVAHSGLGGLQIDTEFDDDEAYDGSGSGPGSAPGKK